MGEYLAYGFLIGIVLLLAMIKIAPRSFPTVVQPLTKEIHDWMGSITYDQMLWTASILMTLANGKTLATYGGPLKTIISAISRFAYTVAGDWQAATMKKEDK